MRGTLSPVHRLPGEVGLQLAARLDLRAASSPSLLLGLGQTSSSLTAHAGPMEKGLTNCVSSQCSHPFPCPRQQRWPHDCLTRLASGSPRGQELSSGQTAGPLWAGVMSPWLRLGQAERGSGPPGHELDWSTWLASSRPGLFTPGAQVSGLDHLR